MATTRVSSLRVYQHAWYNTVGHSIQVIRDILDRIELDEVNWYPYKDENEKWLGTLNMRIWAVHVYR